MASRRTPNQPTHRHTSHHRDSANVHASSSHSADIPNRSASRTPQAPWQYNPVEDPHALDTVGRYTGGDTGSSSGPLAPQTYAPSYMPATSSNNPPSMAMDNSWYPPAQGNHSSGMPEISAPAPQSFGYAAQWPPASSSPSSWNFPPPGPPPRPPLPSRYPTTRPHAQPPPPAVSPLPYPQQPHAGPSGSSSLQHARPSTSSLRGKAAPKPRKSAGKMGIPSWHLHKMKLPSLMGRSKSKSGGAAPPLQPPASVQGPRHGGYRDADNIESDDDDDDGMEADGLVNAEQSPEEKKKRQSTRSKIHRDQIKGLMQRLDRLLWPEGPLPKDEPRTNAQCLERAIEWVGDSVRHDTWQRERSILENRIRDREEAFARSQRELKNAIDRATALEFEVATLRETVITLQQCFAAA